MQHVIVKMYAGGRKRRRRVRQRNHSRAVTTLGYGDEAVSVSIEDVAPKDLVEKVYRPDIADKLGQLYEKPGYNPL